MTHWHIWLSGLGPGLDKSIENLGIVLEISGTRHDLPSYCVRIWKQWPRKVQRKWWCWRESKVLEWLRFKNPKATVVLLTGPSFSVHSWHLYLNGQFTATLWYNAGMRFKCGVKFKCPQHWRNVMQTSLHTVHVLSHSFCFRKTSTCLKRQRNEKHWSNNNKNIL